MTAAHIIRLDNLLQEAKYAAHGGDFRKAELLLAEALTLVALERHLMGQEAAS